MWGSDPRVSYTTDSKSPHKNFLGYCEISLMKFYSRVMRTLSFKFMTRHLRKNLQYSVKPQVFSSFFTFSAWFFISFFTCSLILAWIVGEIVRYLDESARTAVKTLIIFYARGCILARARGSTEMSRSKDFSIISIEMKMIDW